MIICIVEIINGWLILICSAVVRNHKVASSVPTVLLHCAFAKRTFITTLPPLMGVVDIY